MKDAIKSLFLEEAGDLTRRNIQLEKEIEELKEEVIECKKALRLLESFKMVNLHAKKSDAKIKATLKKEVEKLQKIINEIPEEYKI